MIARNFLVQCSVLPAILGLVGAAGPSTSQELPFERTEERETCQGFDPLRLPYFGTTHLHTGRSFDAAIRFVPPGPRDAYRFAKGEAPIKGADPTGRPTREYWIDRPLDWGAVTDHSEHFGEVGICQSDDDPARFSLDCQLINGFYWRPGVGLPRPFSAVTPVKLSPPWYRRGWRRRISTLVCRCAIPARRIVMPRS